MEETPDPLIQDSNPIEETEIEETETKEESGKYKGGPIPRVGKTD